MSDMLRTGLQWLEQQRNSHMSSAITYTRGETSIEVVATHGKTDYTAVDGSGFEIAGHVNDFLILAASFTFDEPEVGDQIATDNGTYEVMQIAGDGHWRWSDPYRATIRVHTREIS